MNDLEKIAHEKAEKHYIQELVNRGYAQEKAEEFVLKSGVPEEMYQVYLKQIKRDYDEHHNI